MDSKFVIFIFCFLFFLQVTAQNLVPNCSFERIDTTICESPFANVSDDLDPWIDYNSVDCLNSCDTSNYVGMPKNRFGYQQAISGRGYIGLRAFQANVFGREYIEVELNAALIINQIYFVRIYVSLADTVQYAIENIGVLFTDTLFDPFPAPTYDWVTGIPQIENSPGNMLNDKLNWVAITGSFIATGGEKYMTIGNFKDDAQTVKQYLGGTTPGTLGAYYFIDDVYVGTTPPIGVEEHAKVEVLAKLYPNPNNASMILECNFDENEKGVLLIYSLTGKLVKTVSLYAGAKSLTIDAQDLDAGMYVYELSINGKTKQKDKLIIIK